MSGMERVEDDMLREEDTGKSREQQRVKPERLGQLPLDALLYYVLYGDEGLTRLT